VSLADVMLAENAKWDPATSAALPESYVGLEHLRPHRREIAGCGDSAEVSSMKTEFRAGDILFGKLRPYLRKVAIAPGNGVCSTDILVLRPRDPALVKADFLYWVLSSTALAEHAVAHSAGTKMPRVSLAALGRFAFRLPPPGEQRQIADLLGAAESSLAAAERCAELTERIRTGLRATALRDASGKRRRLGEVAAFASGVAFPQAHQGGKGGDPFIKVSDMNLPGNEREIVTAENWVEESRRKALKAKLFPPGTVIFPKVGAALKTEKRRLLVRPTAFDNNIMGLLPNEAAIAPEYLLLAMEEVRLAEIAQEGVVPSVNQRIVGSISIPVPSLSEQRRIVALVGRAADAAAGYRIEVAGLQQLRISATAALLTGEHRIPAAA
jgi:type I restriction enzyme, S subunit